ncbi:putative F-box domain-containing protein [Tanacetum coccineum]
MLFNGLMEELIPDIYEKILVRLDARTLGRCKSVCKSWKSLISETRVIKAHLNHSYNINENGHKRIGEVVYLVNDDYGYAIIGSSDGLVCFTDGHELLVANSLTREVKPLPKPSTILKPFPTHSNRYSDKDDSSCWGFGYDFLRDDYKVVCGVIKGKGRTYFQVFSLKSNAWNVIGEVNYACTSSQNPAGVLCNGAIHWVMHPKNQNRKEVILSFDLSKEEFKEIPLPVDAGYKKKIDNCGYYVYMHVGIMEECLCIVVYIGNETCVAKKDNAKQSWEMVDNFQIKRESASNFCEVSDDDPYWWDHYKWFIGNRKFVGGPPIVESLVSPHLQAENE